jgi:hypothetical protein
MPRSGSLSIRQTSEKISGLRGAAAEVLRLQAQHHHWITRNRSTKGRLIRLRPTKGHPLCGATRTWEAPVHAHVPGAFPLGEEGRGCSNTPDSILGINGTFPLRIVSYRSLVGTLREDSSARMFAAWPRLTAGLFWFEQRCQSQTLNWLFVGGGARPASCLPVLLIGGGIYWILRRRKKTKLGS